MTRIAFVYSKNHFQPGQPESRYGNTGAGYLAKEVYGEFSKLYPSAQIDYYDHSEWKQLRRRDRVDLLFGIGSHLSKFRDLLVPEETILFAVNRAAPTRQTIEYQTKDEPTVQGLPLLSHDGSGANRGELDAANKVLQLGSWSNFYANLVSGVTGKNQALVSFKKPVLNRELEIEFLSRNPGTSILFLAGTIVLRKGLHVIHPLAEELQRIRSPHKLVIVGQSSNPVITAFLEDCCRRYPDNLIWRAAFIPAHSSEWKDLFRSSAIAIAPSFEEGQQDAAMECIARGIPVLHSAEIGFEALSTKALMADESSSAWVHAVLELLSDRSLREEIYLSQELLYSSHASGISHISAVLAMHKDSNWRSLSAEATPPISRTSKPEDFLMLFEKSEAMGKYAAEYLRLRYPNLRARLVPLSESSMERAPERTRSSSFGQLVDSEKLYFRIGSWAKSALSSNFWIKNDWRKFLNAARSGVVRNIPRLY